MKYKTLKELCEVISDCPHSTPKWTDHGKIVVRNNNIKNGRIDLSSPSYTDEENFRQRIKRVIPQPGDLIITREAPMGEVGMIPEGIECCLGQRMVLLRANPQECDNYYLLYSIQSREVQHQISWSEGTGTTVSNLRIPHLEQLKIPYLPLKEQEKIVAILKSLDGKIALNNKINDNLEQQAQLLYKQYFPYSVNDKLPDGWHVGAVGEIVEIHDAKRIPLSGAERAKMKKKTYPYYGAAALMDYVDDYIFDGKYLLLGEGGTVVDNAGYPILQYVWGQFWVNNHAHVLTGKLGFNVESLYMLFKHTQVKSIVTGAVQPKISQANLRSIPVVIPPENLLIEYNSQIEPMFALFRANDKASKTLTVLRDTLLPKLMNGEIDITNIG